MSLEDKGLETKSDYMISQETSLHSIAISLKRIADMMQGKQQPVIMSAEEYAKYQEIKK